MTTISETGHAKNVSNLDELVSFVTGYGVTYNPTKASIKLTALQALLLSSKTSLKAVNDVYPAYSLAVAAREQAFLPLSKIATRILNALKATDASVQVIDDAKTIIRKIQGSRVTPKKTEAEKQALLAKGKLSKEISTSQMSYDNRLENLDKLINLLANIPEYTPNEAELKIPALKELFSNLSDKNKDVIDTSNGFLRNGITTS